MCASLYGVAVNQGWAATVDKVANKNADTRRCNVAADFSHVLTMTGVTFDHLVIWLKTRVCNFGDGKLLVVRFFGRNDRRVGGQWEMDTWVGHLK